MRKKSQFILYTVDGGLMQFNVSPTVLVAVASEKLECMVVGFKSRDCGIRIKR